MKSVFKAGVLVLTMLFMVSFTSSENKEPKEKLFTIEQVNNIMNTLNVDTSNREGLIGVFLAMTVEETNLAILNSKEFSKTQKIYFGGRSCIFGGGGLTTSVAGGIGSNGSSYISVWKNGVMIYGESISQEQGNAICGGQK